MHFQNKYVNSNNKVYQLFQLEENKYLMSPRVPLIITIKTIENITIKVSHILRKLTAYWRSPICSKYSRSCGVSGSESEQTNSRLSIATKVSDKMRDIKEHAKVTTTCIARYSLL